MSDRERAQSSLIGTVLLLGITVAAVTATVATGSVALAAVTDEAQSASVENGMSQLTAEASLVALGETNAKRFDVGSVDGGDLRLDEDAGRVEVRVERPNGTNSNASFRLGALVYESDRGEVAVQGGGVWASGDGGSQMVSPPEYHYRGSTLTFPVVRLTGDESSPNGGSGVVRQSNASRDVFPDTANPLVNGTVVVEVQSDYYEGWYDFFTERAEGDVTKDDANRTVTARLVVPGEVTFDRTLAVSQQDGYTHTGSSNGRLAEDEYTEGESHPSADSLIADEVESAAADNDNDAETCVKAGGFDDCEDPIGSGVYYFDGDATVSDDVVFNTTDGNVTVVVDGTFDVGDSDVTVTDDSDNDVTYYVNGSLRLQGGAYVGTAPDPIQAERNVFYVADGFLDGSDGEGNPTIEAIVYAPDADVVTNGNPTLRGAFVTNTLETGGNAQVEYDPNLADLEITIVGGPGESTVTYLHVSENVVELRFDR